MNLHSPVSGHFRYLTQEETRFLQQNQWFCSYCREDGIDSPLVTHSDKAEQHSFHRRCIIPWVKEHGKCMLCFQAVSWAQIATFREWLSHHTPLKRVITPLQQFSQLAASSPEMQIFLLGISVALAGYNTSFRFAASFGFLVLSGSFFFARREWSEKSQLFSAALPEINNKIEGLRVRKNYLVKLSSDICKEYSRLKLGQRKLRQENIQQVVSTNKRLTILEGKACAAAEEIIRIDRAQQRAGEKWWTAQADYRNSQALWFTCALAQCAALTISVWLLYAGTMPQGQLQGLRS